MAAQVTNYFPVMSQRLRPPDAEPRPPPEIIDVDAFDLPPRPPRFSPRPPPRRPPPTWHPGPEDQIFFVDSDDELEILPTRALSGHDAARERSHRQFISPPPLPREADIPPVPIIHFRPRDPDNLTPPPMRPNPRPLPFERSIIPHVPRRIPVPGPSHPPNPQRPLAAAPISRHVPPLGLGGALISSNNRAQSMQRHARAAAASTASARRPPAIRNLQQTQHFLAALHDNFFGELRTYVPYRPSVDRPFGGEWGPAANKDTPPREKEPYQPHYTHPFQPEPGFTYDFALPSPDDDVGSSRLFPPTSIDKPIILDDEDEDDDDVKFVRPSELILSGPSTSAHSRADSPASGTLDAILVCANCLDPLVLNAGLAPEEAQYRRIWGLRCGHLIDEQCLNKIGHPAVEEEVVKDRKGKGKAKAKAAPPRATYPDALVAAPESHAQAEAESTTDIRSRLRSRPTASSSSGDASSHHHHNPHPHPHLFSSSSSSSSPSSFATPTPDTPHQPPTKRRRGPNKKPKVEAEFEWNCPVPGCGRVHVSVKIDGVWGPETEKDFKGVKGLKTEARGAVAVFA